MNDIKISIITPVYNRLYLIKDLVNSLKKQKFKNYEWVIIDNNSTEDVKGFVDELIKEGLSVKYTKEIKQGVSPARNKGIDVAVGKYITIMDSDDWYYDEYSLENLYNEIEKDNDIKLVFGNFVYYYHNQNKYIEGQNKTLYFDGYSMLYYFLVGNIIIPSSVIIDKNVLKSIRFDDEIEYADDLKLWIDFLGNGYKMKNINKKICYWRTDYKDKTSNDFLKLHYNVDKAIIKAYNEGSINLKRLYNDIKQYKDVTYPIFLKFLLYGMLNRNTTPYSFILEVCKEYLKYKKDSEVKKIYRDINKKRKMMLTNYKNTYKKND